MKKIIGLILVLNMSLIVGCQSKTIVDDNGNSNIKVNETPYTIEEALNNGDIVNVHGNITNYEKLEAFMENINNKIEDNIKIVQYTIEGDPIIIELKYDGKDLSYKYDNTRDKFGTPTLKEEKYKPEDFYENIFGYFIATEDQDIFIIERPVEEDLLSNIDIDENTFIGVISEINDNSAIVDVEEGDILNSSDKVVIELINNEEVNFKVGDRVKVEHSGLIRESYPAQIDTISVDRIEN